MQSTYKVELNRLVKEGIISEVKEHTECINSIVPVMKSNVVLRLCLDPKDLNKVIERPVMKSNGSLKTVPGPKRLEQSD